MCKQFPVLVKLGNLSMNKVCDIKVEASWTSVNLQLWLVLSLQARTVKLDITLLI